MNSHYVPLCVCRDGNRNVFADLNPLFLSIRKFQIHLRTDGLVFSFRCSICGCILLKTVEASKKSMDISSLRS